MNKRSWFSALILSLFMLTGCQSDDSHIALGTLERDSLTLSSLVSETITSLPVSEGEQVKAGQLLAELDDRYAQAQLTQAQAQLKQTQATFNEAQHGARSEQIDSAFAAWQASQATYTDAQRQYRRSKELFTANAVGQATLDNAKSLRDQTEAQAEQKQQQWLELKNGTRQEVLMQLEAQVEAAQAQVAAAQVILSHYHILAPQDAIIDNVPWHQGDSVTAGTPLFRLIIEGRPYARIYIPQAARVALQKHAKVRVLINGYNTPFTGVVHNIRSQPAYTPYYALNEKERSRLMYLADITVKNAQDVPTGMALEVQLP